MRKYHLYYLIAIIFTGLTSARFVISGRAHDVPRPADDASNANPPVSGNTAVALRGTTLLATPVADDMREEQRQQVIRYFTSRIAATPAKRDALWRPDFSSSSAYKATVEQHRAHLRSMLGLSLPQLGAPANLKSLLDDANLLVEDVTLPARSGLSAQALVFFPKTGPLAGGIITIPPATQGREEFAGVLEGTPPAAWLKALLDRNIAVAIPVTINRSNDHPICKQAGGRDRRRVLWRAGFIVGRTLAALDVEQALLLRDFLGTRPQLQGKPIAIMGQGDGGMTALYAAAMDEKFVGAASLDYFQQRENSWQEPVDRVINGELNEFGDAEVAALIAPRPLMVGPQPESAIPVESVRAELTRA